MIKSLCIISFIAGKWRQPRNDWVLIGWHKNPLKEYDYANNNWVINNSGGFLDDQKWANTSLDYSVANNFPVFDDVLALRLAHVGTFLHSPLVYERFSLQSSRIGFMIKMNRSKSRTISLVIHSFSIRHAPTCASTINFYDYTTRTKTVPMRYSSRTCKLSVETIDDITNGPTEKCFKAKVLCKELNGTIFEITDIEFKQCKEACAGRNASFC